MTGRLARCRLYEQRYTRRVEVRCIAGSLRLARDGETFDGSEQFMICKSDEPLVVFAPRPYVSQPFVARRLDPDARYGLRVTLFAAAFLLVAIPFGWLLNQVESDGSLVDLDTSGAAALHDWVHRTTFAVGTLKAVTFLGAPPWLWFLVIVGTLVLVRARLWRLALFLVVTTALGGILDTVVKIAVNRPRPSVLDPIISAHGKSFPSGHAMSSTIVYGALLLVFLPDGAPSLATGGHRRHGPAGGARSGSPGWASASTTSATSWAATCWGWRGWRRRPPRSASGGCSGGSRRWRPPRASNPRPPPICRRPAAGPGNIRHS